MARKVRYRIQSVPTPAGDGSGARHDVWGIYSDDNWVTTLIIGGYHKDGVTLPTASLKTIMDMAQTTTAEKKAKRIALKELIRVSIVTQAQVPTPDWTEEGMLAYLAAVDAEAVECAREVEFVVATLGKTFPWDIATE